MGISILVDSSGDAVLADEGSTLGIVVGFTDDDGAAETPTSADWTLTDENGTVINSREEVTINSLAASVTVTLSGNDLDLLAGETGETAIRHFLVQAVYSSDLGNDLPLVKAVAFPIVNAKYAI